MSQKEKDLNSIFDDVCINKQSEQNRLNSFEEGKISGRLSGYEQGFEFGLKMATAYGAELGYSSFLAKYWKTKLEISDKSKNNQRKIIILDQLIDQCDNAPRENDPNVEFGKVVQKLQIKFKHANSLFGDKKQFDGPNFLSSDDSNTNSSTCGGSNVDF